MQDPTVTAIAWLRNQPRRLPWLALGTTTIGTMAHVAITALSDVWPAIFVVVIDLIAAFLLMISGAAIALYGVEMAIQTEQKRYPASWLNTTPSPSTEPLGATDERAPDQLLRDGKFIVPPEALGSICIGPPEPLPGFEHIGTDSIQKEYEPVHASPEQRLLDDIFPEVGDNYPVLISIHEEMLAQVDQWGYQFHPHGTGGSTARMNRTNAKKAVEAAVAAGTLTWVDVLREEFTEAVAETDLLKLDEELTQIAAVCATWKQAIAHEMATAIGMEADPE